jgi:hypothetical protein
MVVLIIGIMSTTIAIIIVVRVARVRVLYSALQLKFENRPN